MRGSRDAQSLREVVDELNWQIEGEIGAGRGLGGEGSLVPSLVASTSLSASSAQRWSGNGRSPVGPSCPCSVLVEGHTSRRAASRATI